jgi:hypothetical protein
MNKHKLLYTIDKFVTKYLMNCYGLIILIPALILTSAVRLVYNFAWWTIRDIKIKIKKTWQQTSASKWT